MPHDYKNAPTQQAPESSGGHGFLWGLLIGLSVAAVLWFVNQDKEKIEAAQPAVPPQAVEIEPPKQEPQDSTTATTPDTAATEENIKPVEEKSPFSFYESLRDFEIIISADELERTTPPPAPEPSDAANTSNANLDANAHYKIQIGSFRSAEDAERRREEIGVIGLTSNIQTVEIGPGQVWHRVYVGPLSEAREIEDTLDILAGNGFDFLVTKVKVKVPVPSLETTETDTTPMGSTSSESDPQAVTTPSDSGVENTGE